MKRSRSDLLCLDAGNTRIKAAVWRNGRWAPLAAVPLRRFSAARRRPWPARQVDGVGRVLVSSVVPSIAPAMQALARDITGRAAWFPTYRSPFPFRIAVPRPGAVGIDRLCAAAGAVGRRKTAVIVVDVGSAITVDLVAGGTYRGGFIMAGPGTALRALGTLAEQLPDIDFAAVSDPFATPRTNTRAAMILGTAHGTVGAIREAVRSLRPRGPRPRVVLTGGGADILRPQLPASWSWRPGLVLEGLRTVWQEHEARRS